MKTNSTRALFELAPSVNSVDQSVTFFNYKKRHAIRIAMALAAMGALGLAGGAPAIANPVAEVESVRLIAQQATPTPAETETEIDTSITREYEPVTVYVPDPQTQELIPKSVLVTSDEPVEGAVDEIVQAYEGEAVGITGYQVNVNETAREAEINFAVENPNGYRALQSLSSANQYSLFEAIRETLLTEPKYGVDEVIFQANHQSFDI